MYDKQQWFGFALMAVGVVVYVEGIRHTLMPLGIVGVALVCVGYLIGLVADIEAAYSNGELFSYRPRTKYSVTSMSDTSGKGVETHRCKTLFGCIVIIIGFARRKRFDVWVSRHYWR